MTNIWRKNHSQVLRAIIKKYKLIKTFLGEFPGSPVVKTPRFHRTGSRVRSLVGETKIPHAVQQGQKEKISPKQYC